MKNMSKITYANKQALNENTSIADINKVKASDLNEIKEVVNQNDDNTTNNTTEINTINNKIGDLNNLETTDKSSVINAINEINNRFTYSTDEKVIGTWLGKPLYRKVVEYTFLEANKDNTVTTIPNLEYFTKIEGFFIEGINRFLVPYSYNNEAINCYTSDNTLYEIHNYSFPNNKTAFITIEYTKTTD